MRFIIAKRCYGHLGGKLGDILFERMLELGWLKLAEEKSRIYEITEKGYNELTELGIDLSKLKRKRDG